VQGSVCSWVALHRRHHRFADQPGDPHSARPIGSGPYAFVRALVHSHVGWLFNANPTFEERYAADLLRDRDLRIVSSLFPLFAIGSFALSASYPFALALLFAAGFVELSFLAMAQTLVQLHAPPEMRGRVIGAFAMSAQGLRAFSGVTVGIGGSLIGIHWSLAASAGLLFAVLALGLVFATRWRS